MIYGATGYTGRLIARHAAERGLKPVLAGRNYEAVATLAGELDCPAGDETRVQSDVFSKSSLLAPHTGHTQSAGRLSNGVPAAIPLSGSPLAGS